MGDAIGIASAVLAVTAIVLVILTHREVADEADNRRSAISNVTHGMWELEERVKALEEAHQPPVVCAVCDKPIKNAEALSIGNGPIHPQCIAGSRFDRRHS